MLRGRAERRNSTAAYDSAKTGDVKRLVSAALFVVFPATALAADLGPNDASLNAKPERRSGLIFGTSGGFALGTAKGYPNDARKIGDPAYYAAGGAMPGYAVNFFVMGALVDVFNFGLWFGKSQLSTGDWSSSGIAGGFRIEAYPLYSVWKPFLKDFGVSAQFGVGGASLDASRPSAYEGSSGTQSFLGLGAFYELRPFKRFFTIAPDVELNYITARAIDRYWVQLGARIAITTGP